MNHQGGKDPRWIADRIAAAFEAATGEPAPDGGRLSRPELDDLVATMLEEELERLEEDGEGLYGPTA
jgi:hypothetical protein